MTDPPSPGQASAVLEGDVCVIGAGPVGLTLALALADRGARVVLLESGSGEGPLDVAPWDDHLHGLVAPPGGLAPLGSTRARGLGGTARLWNTRIAETITAKLVPLAAIDLEPRPGREGSWPFGFEELAPWFREATMVCGLAPGLWSLPHAPGAIRRGDLESGYYGFAPASRFTAELVASARRHGGVTLRTDATVVELLVATGRERIVGARWVESASGREGVVRAERVVLTAGALENARILLLPTARRAPWSTLDWIGRGLMEHPIDRSVTLLTRARELSPTPTAYLPHPVATAEGSAWRMGWLGLSPDRLRAAELSNAAVRITPGPAPWALRALASAASRPARAVRKGVTLLMRGERALRRLALGARYPLHIDLEQAPDPANRVRLADDRDALGRARLRVEWSWTAGDEQRRLRLLDALEGAMADAGLGRLERRPGLSIDPNAHHHAGTTRMHVDPSEGVVDPALQVHGCEGLFVCGSSVFPTAGFANPTLTAVALALRLADYLFPDADAPLE